MNLSANFLKQPERIAVFRALYLGDLLVAVPALRALRALFPRAEITLIGLPWAATFVQRYHHYVDRLVEFPGYPGLKESNGSPADIARFIAEQRAYKYDLVIQMHGSGKTSNSLIMELNGKCSVGYYENNKPENLHIAAPYPQHQHEIFRNLGLVALLGQTELDPHLEFPLHTADYAEVAALLYFFRKRMTCSLDGLDPPGIAGEGEQDPRLLPELLKLVDERVLQLVERRENGIGELLADMPEDLLGRIEFRAVGGQIERMHVLGPAHFTTAMTARTVQHHPDWTLSQLLTHMLQEELQALAFHGRQQEEDARPRGRLYRGIQPQPLVVVLHDPRGTFPQRTPAPAQPGDQAKAAFIQGHDPLELWLLDQAPEVFLKAACCSALAFLCRLRPVFHLTRCFLKSHQSDLPFL